MAAVLSCQLPAAFFSAWYALIGELVDDRLATHLPERLLDARVNREWLESMADAYADIASWVDANYRAPWSEPSADGIIWLDSTHSAVANWLMASDLLFNVDTPSGALQAKLHEMTEHLPVRARGVIVAGTLGQPVSDSWAVAPPSVPATWPQIEGVAEAYSGLLHRLVALEDAESQETPDELALTAVLWRLGALVDGMEPRRDDHDGIEQRLIRLTPGPIYLSSAEDNLRRSIARFGEHRNVLTHLTSDGGATFPYVIDQYATIDDVRERVSLITASMFFKIAEQLHLSEPPFGELRRVEHDIEVSKAYVGG